MIVPSADVKMYALAFPWGFTCAYMIIRCPNKELLVIYSLGHWNNLISVGINNPCGNIPVDDTALCRLLTHTPCSMRSSFWTLLPTYSETHTGQNRTRGTSSRETKGQNFLEASMSRVTSLTSWWRVTRKEWYVLHNMMQHLWTGLKMTE